VLNGDPADIALTIKIEDRVLIKVFGISDLNRAKLDL
jgi:hypothetical protein